MGAIVLAETPIIDQWTSDHCLPGGTITLLAAHRARIFCSSPPRTHHRHETENAKTENKYSCCQHAGDVTPSQPVCGVMMGRPIYTPLPSITTGPSRNV